MLYERWLEISRIAPDRLAVWDGVRGRGYSFRALAEAAEGAPGPGAPVHFARGRSVDFIVSVLAAWRSGKALMPLEMEQPAPELEQWPGAEVVHLKTTSATGGRPRMIAFNTAQLAADCDNVTVSMGLDPSLPNVGAISLAHSYGFSNLVLPLLLKGVPLLLAASALPESVRTAVEQVPAVALPAVPALWQTWNDAGILSDRIRIAISAGAPLPLELERDVFESAGLKIHNFYGSSECGGIAYDRTAVPREDPSIVGTPLRGVTVGINPEGCVTVRSEAVAMGYWPANENALADGRFETGDLGEVTRDGVHLRGRASDRINVAGRKVVPEEVERALAAHPDVKDCLVFGVPSDGVRNETIVACVQGGSEVSPGQLTEFLRGKLPAWQLPRQWWMVDSLSVNQRGKRSRAEWRERYLARAAGAP